MSGARRLSLWVLLSFSVAHLSLSCRSAPPTRSAAAPDRDADDVSSRIARQGFPRLALQLQLCCRQPAIEAAYSQMSKWDLGVVDGDAVIGLPEYLGPLGKIRRENPNAVLLAYFSPADLIEGAQAPLRRRYAASFDPAWILHDTQGQAVPLYHLPNGKWTKAVNLATGARTAIPEFLLRNIMASGLVDGLLLDWTSSSISWLNHRKPPLSGPIDLDGNGKAESDATVDSTWRGAYLDLLANARRTFPQGAVLVGNGGWVTGPEYAPAVNGIMVEQFLEGEPQGAQYGWTAVMRMYANYEAKSAAPRLSLVMANRDGGNDRPFMRFALASTLMFDGYFAFTNRSKPTPAYQDTHWYDEYSVDLVSGRAAPDLRFKGYLGRPLGVARSVGGGRMLAQVLAGSGSAENDAWQRDFEHGRVLVNPTGRAVHAEFDRRFRRILGDDRLVNDGSTISAAVLPPRSGTILLRVE